MDIDANLEVLWAALQPPPGHERTRVEAEPLPAGAGVFEMQVDLSRKPGPAGIDRLEAAVLIKRGVAPDTLAPESDARQRLVSAPGHLGGAITEAVADQARHPVSAVGRVTASFDGRLRYCTGTVVTERVVLTAAHCTFSRGADLTGARGFADWILFQPQYKGNGGAGNWAGEAAYILSGWKAPAPGTSAGAHDFSLIRLDAPIAQFTGTAGMLANTVPEGPFSSLGYPRQPGSGFAFDGRFLFASTGERIDDGSVHVIKAENGLTEGSSGGPWMMLSGEELLVAGLNSTKPLDSDAHTWSPLFGEGLQKLFARVLADMTGA